MTVNVGIAGLGHMGLLHLRNTRFMDKARVIAVADKSKKALSEARAHGIKELHYDYRNMLKCKNLSAVILALPNFLHERSIIEATEENLHVFVEKPLARTVSECENIKRAVGKHDVKLVVGSNYRYFEHVQRLKSEYDKGKIGDVEIANFEHFVNGPFAHPRNPVPVRDWWLDAQMAGGGVLLDQGYHLIDLFRWFFPDPDVLYSSLGYRYNLDIEDSATVVLQSKSTSTRGIVNVGWFQKMVFPEFNFRINLHGTVRFLSTDHFAPSNLYMHAAKESLKNFLRRILRKRIDPLSYTYYYASYFQEMQDFFESIEDDSFTAPCATVDDGLETIKIIKSSYDLANSTKRQES